MPSRQGWRRTRQEGEEEETGPRLPPAHSRQHLAAGQTSAAGQTLRSRPLPLNRAEKQTEVKLLLSCAALPSPLPTQPSLVRYEEAERRFKEAIDEARAGFPANDPHIPSALHYLAEFYRNMGRLDEAEPLYRQVCVVCAYVGRGRWMCLHVKLTLHRGVVPVSRPPPPTCMSPSSSCCLCAPQTLSQLGDFLGERHWMYSAALCSLAALHEARGEYSQVGGHSQGGQMGSRLQQLWHGGGAASTLLHHLFTQQLHTTISNIVSDVCCNASLLGLLCVSPAGH